MYTAGHVVDLFDSRASDASVSLVPGARKLVYFAMVSGSPFLACLQRAAQVRERR